MNVRCSLLALLQSHLARALMPFFLLSALISTAGAQEAPAITNEETGAQVPFTRAYWNANVDIASKRMQCDYYEFNPETAVYEMASGGGSLTGVWLQSSEFFHNALTEGAGFGTVAHAYLAQYRDPVWHVADGEYRGIAPLANTQFVELVTHNAASAAATTNAVRIWYSADLLDPTSSLYPLLQSSGPAFHLCYDLDGAALIPTGSPETGNTDLLPEQNFTFQLPAAGTPVTETPEIIRIDTGEPVEFVRAEFDYNGDFKGKRMNCGLFRWDDEFGRYVPSFRGSGQGTYYSFYHQYTGGSTLPISTAPDDYRESTYDVGIAGFLAGSVRGSFIEIVDSGYNIWSTRSTFEGCRLSESFGIDNGGPFAPNRILLTPQDSCDYSNADQNGGWGWNPATTQTCAPLTSDQEVADECDYSNADSFNGWGWNAATRESCPPLEQSTPSNPDTATDNCDYSAADQFDGWGWDPIARQSCAPLDNTPEVTDDCDYSDAASFDGWGWNPVTRQSCPPVEADTPPANTACIDSDGDGWGWDGTASCLVTTDNSPDEDPSNCIDTTPVGDGWGWNGVSSCRVAVEADIHRCDAVDGSETWGWNPSLARSCRLALNNIPDPLPAVSSLPALSPAEIFNVPLQCRRVQWWSQFETNPVFDLLAIETDPSRIYYSATFRATNTAAQTSSSQHEPVNIEGSWADTFSNNITLEWDQNRDRINYSVEQQSGPYPGGEIRSYRDGEFIVIYRIHSHGDIGEFVTSYCVAP